MPDPGAAGAAPREPHRLGGAEVAERLARLDETLAGLERTPGATAETAMAAVTTLAEVYGETLARVMDRVAGEPRIVEALLGDELVGHLLVLHDVHPEPVERRIARALDGLRRQGVTAELAGVDGGTVRIRTAGGCGCSAGGAEEAVRETVLAVAPEASRVEFAGAPPAAPAFVPVDALLRPPVPAADGAP
ncbi:NifU family protein [Actinomadura verrucosospora]|uniref:Nitrogen-fixing NifU-like protein n=1 Tax=Actinomadura verrucosospora TaxID=46165 RepID=A0A7D3W1I7_ACTVE|nr:NifU family protein [Actinomadura verrucosospora]QKG26978.1 nitrogen-fixing NifU-like protein [Actinomadura verrucosospora]